MWWILTRMIFKLPQFTWTFWKNDNIYVILRKSVSFYRFFVRLVSMRKKHILYCNIFNIFLIFNTQLLISLSVCSNDFCWLLFQHAAIHQVHNCTETLNVFYKLVIKLYNIKYKMCFVHYTITTKLVFCILLVICLFIIDIWNFLK